MSGYLTIEVGTFNFYRARAAVIAANDGKTYRGIFKDTIENLLKSSLSYARDIVHVDTWHLHNALDWKYDSHLMRGEVYVSGRTAWNSSKHVRREPQKYAIYEEKRGGGHAFMARTMREFTRHGALPRLFAEVRSYRWP